MVKIICDENIPQSIISQLSSLGYSLLVVRDVHPGLTDKALIKMALDQDATILTFDKDFLEMAKFNKKYPKIIFMRFLSFQKNDFEKVINFLHERSLLNNSHAILSIQFNAGNLIFTAS